MTIKKKYPSGFYANDKELKDMNLRSSSLSKADLKTTVDIYKKNAKESPSEIRYLFYKTNSIRREETTGNYTAWRQIVGSLRNF